MTRILGVATIVIAVAGCVTTGKFNEQVEKTEAEQQRADKAEKALAAAQQQIGADQRQVFDLKATIDANEKKQHELEARIKADADQIASLQKSNGELQTSLKSTNSSKGEEIAQLVKEKDALSQQLADLQATTTAQIADLNKKLADIQAQKDAELAKMKQNFDNVTASLKSEIDNGNIQISEFKGRLTLNVGDKVLFRPGEADVNEEGRKVLDQIGEVLNTKVLDKDIRVEGYTDDRPITGELTKRYATNWELSTARATAVVRYLQDKDSVDPHRLVAAGYGEFRPAVANDTPENRALNRHIEIALIPKE